MRTILLMLFLVAPGAHARAQSAGKPAPRETYASASVDSAGNLDIVTAGGRHIVIPPDSGQAGFGDPQVTPDGSAVGASALYPNCCTAYPVPMQLVVYAGGTAHRFKADLPIVQWAFADGGTRVAYGQQPLRQVCETRYELHEVEAERLVESFSVEHSCDAHPEPRPVRLPPWVKALVSP